jgi:GAF domain-containing protein
MQCPRCPQDNPSHAVFCLKCGIPLQGPDGSPQPAPSYADLQRSLTEALERETATSEILQIISSSPTDVQPVFNTIASTAARLCESFDSIIWRQSGNRLVVVAHHGPIPIEPGGLPLTRESVPGRAVLDGRTVHLTDLQAQANEFPIGSDLARRHGFRTTLNVPLMRDAAAIGVITVRRTEVRPFSERQVAILQTFADQAVIAIENVRLFNETKEALEQQSATSEILRVISSSPTDVQPVFDAILRSAVTLCNSLLGNVVRVDGDLVRLVATLHPRPEEVAAIYPAPLTAPLPPCRAIRENAVVHVPDVEAAGAIPPAGLQVTRAAGIRSLLVVPMRRGEQPIGAILIARPAVGPFPDEQIALLQTFADQAVIAIENVRLFTELQQRNGALTEALTQQTATSEVLKVISRSAFDLEPVLESLVENAVRLCGADKGLIYRQDADLYRIAVSYGHSSEFLEVAKQYPIRQDRASATGRAVLECRAVHIHDILADPEYTWAEDHRAEEEMHRTILAVPMLREGSVIGVIVIRRTQVLPFTDKQIELVTTFADQAVIAIENVRLFTELQEKNRALTEAHVQITEALEQQTATSEILRVISQSPTDVQPVLDTVAENVTRLCDAEDVSILERDGEVFRVAAYRGASRLRDFEGTSVSRGSVAGRAILDRQLVHVHDITEESEAEFPVSKAIAQHFGHRTMLAVPLLREGARLGAIFVRQTAVRPFSDKQIELLRTFADQAVIAIENVRLFTELQEKNRALTEVHAQVTEALEQQTATAEILRVISSSPTDVQPVFDTIVSSAVRLCDGLFGALYRFDGELLHLVAHYNYTPEALEAAHRVFPGRPSRGGGPGRAILDRAVAHIPDVQLDLEHRYPAVARAVGWRSGLFVPMLREGAPIGVIAVTRAEPGPFSDSEIELLKTFADQAVIAVENVRLFTELQQKNGALTQAHAQVSESLEQQMATSEILRAISSSPTDIQPVFDIIAESAVRLCGAEASTVTRFDGEWVHLVAVYGSSPEGVDAVRRSYPMRGGGASAAARSIRDCTIAHIPDVLVDEEYGIPEAAVASRFRAALAVPMLHEGRAIGAIAIGRSEPGEFNERQVDLLRTFADQALIAIENVRLFKELQARTGELTQSVEKLTALGEVSQALSSTLDVETVLDTIVSRASQLAGAAGCSIYEYDEGAEQFELRATHNYDAEVVEALRAAPLRKGEGIMGRAAEMREPVQVADITQPGAYQSSVRDTLNRFGYRALLSVPLLRENQIIGSLSFNRKAPGEFPPEVVDVLKTFATQSALAIQNARLFREIADKSAQLEAASRHKSEFLANMSHELRTPLNAIIGFSEVLTERMFGELNEKQEEYLKDIYASGTHLLSLINDILDLSKIEAGRMELELTDFHLPTALDSALTLVRERAARRGIALDTNVDAQLGQIQADERKIRQVVLNLLSNAIKFTPEGGRIAVGAVPKDGFVEVSVSDTGIGIAPEDQEAVFEEFRQVGTAEKKAEGTGLGLTLCRKFVELHGGRIWVKSQVGEGSTFTFAIPVRRGEARSS